MRFIIYYLLFIILILCGSVYAEMGMIYRLNTGETTPKVEGRSDTQIYYSSCRLLESAYCKPWGGVAKRPGTYYIANIEESYTLIEAVPAIPAVVTYKLTYISENGDVWGIPVGDREMNSFDSDDAVDIGGGVVGLPYTDHPFTIGETIRITNTSYYNGDHTVGAGTTANQIQITIGYNAETFDGTEIIILDIGGIQSGSGEMVQDSDGNMYCGHSWSAVNSTYVTKIEADGTLVYNFLNHSWSSGGLSAVGLALSQDEAHLYIYMHQLVGYELIEKYELSSGNLVWSQAGAHVTGYDMAIDSSDNLYLCDTPAYIYSPADGSRTTMTLMGEGKEAWVVESPYALAVDNDLGIVIWGGNQYCLTGYDESVLYNLAVRLFDDSAGDQMAVGGTYIYGSIDATRTIGTGHVVTHGGYIYVLIKTSATTTELHKLQWDGSSIVAIDDVAGPTYGTGLYFDLYDNLVVINQDDGAQQDDVLYFYDEDLAYLSKIENMWTSLLSSWASPAGGAWIQGNAVFDGVLGTETPGTPGLIVENDFGEGQPVPVRLIDYATSDEKAYIIALGNEHMTFLTGN